MDSNVFFYARILDRKYGVACATILKDVATKRIESHISTLILLEVGNALQKYNLRKEVASETNAIASLPIKMHHVDSSIIGDALRIHAQNDVGIYDCAHAATMQQMDITSIISADHDFDRISWITRIDPLKYSL